MQRVPFVRSRPGALFEIDELSQCRDGVSGRMTVGRWASGGDGRTAVGALGVFADEVLGYSLMASLEPGSWSISTEIWLDVVGELPGEGAALLGHGRPVQAGSYAVGELRDQSGNLVVECRQRGRRVPAPADLSVAEEDVPAQPGPDGLVALLGLRAEGTAHVLDMRPDLANPRGALHGGVSLAASEVVAARSRAEADCDLQTSSVHIVHTRGVPLGASLVLDAETRHAGRGLWVTEVIGTVAGRTATVATVTAQ